MISETPQAKVDTHETHQAKSDTCSSSKSEGEHSKHPKTAESDIRIGNYRPAQPIVTVDGKHKSDHEITQFFYILEPRKKDN